MYGFGGQQGYGSSILMPDGAIHLRGGTRSWTTSQEPSSDSRKFLRNSVEALKRTNPDRLLGDEELS